MSQKKFSVGWNSVSQAPPATGFNIIGASTVRPRIYEIHWGSTPVAPVDQASTLLVGRTSVVGTAGSSPTPTPLDNQEVAAVCTAGIAHSGEPTYGVTLLQIPLNHRASFRQVVNQDYEYMGAAVASNGVAAKQSASTANYGLTGTVFFIE